MELLRILGIPALMLAGGPLFAQYDKVAALGSDSALTPFGGPASSPPISSQGYDLPDLRPTGELNDRLPEWLQFGLEERLRLEESPGAGWYLLNRLRIGMLLRPAGWLRIVSQVQDARSLFVKSPLGPPNDVRWDLKIAYAQFGDSEKQPISLTIGRQVIDYNDTIIGNSEWRNQARSYDGLVTNLHVKRLRASLFALSVVTPQLDDISHHQHGNNIYGAYGWLTRILPRSAIEPFVLWRVAPKVATEGGTFGRLDERAFGIRIRGTGVSNFDYRGELVMENGRAGSNRIQAWATTAGMGYTAATLPWKPRFFAGYDFASGDKNPNDGIRHSFDTMYPTAHDRFGIADQFGWQNIVAWRGGGTIVPHRRWSLTAQCVDLRLASATAAAYNSSGGVIRIDGSGKSGKRLGTESDLYTWYEINRQVHIGAGVGHLRPGEFLARAGKAILSTYPYFAIEMLDGKRIR